MTLPIILGQLQNRLLEQKQKIWAVSLAGSNGEGRARGWWGGRMGRAEQGMVDEDGGELMTV